MPYMLHSVACSSACHHDVRAPGYSLVYISCLQGLETELMVQVLPSDPLDEKNIMIEIRAGTGGDEASMWAGDLLRMYEKFCLTQGWKSSIVVKHVGEYGGYKDVTIEVKGDQVYSKLKYEAGVHCTSTPITTLSQHPGLDVLQALTLLCVIVSSPPLLSSLQVCTGCNAYLQPRHRDAYTHQLPA